MNIIFFFLNILHNFGKNVNFRNLQTNCRVNSKNCVFVSTYPHMISVSFHTFFFTFGKVTDFQSFKEQDKSSDNPSATAKKKQ